MKFVKKVILKEPIKDTKSRHKAKKAHTKKSRLVFPNNWIHGRLRKLEVLR